MEPDSHEDVLSVYTTKTKMLIRHIMRSDGRQIEIERRVKEIAVAIDRRNGTKSSGTLWAWAKKVLSFASAEASKIRIDE
jgi:hypothetical protein